jgi:outer membrane receptor protein involved in Fe transport
MKNYILYTFLFFLPILKINAQDKEMPDTTSNLMSRELQEVVISASKDNVTHKTIPASVSVISSDIIKDNEIKTLNEISSTAPNFFMPDYGSKLTAPVYIRGIGSRINSPSVGLYVDYVPYFEKAAFDFDFFDIKSIEVLRGPQGTLFGRNTMGGIVNIVTTSPMDYQGTHLNLSAGNYGAYSMNVGHYGKAKNFAYSLAVNALHNDGFYTNAYSGNKVDNLNSVGLRNRLIYEVTPRLTMENIAAFERSRQGGYPYAIYNDSLRAAEPINYNQYSSYDRNLFSDALLIRYTSPVAEITSTTAYQYLKDSQKIDQDFTPDSLYFIIQDQNQHMISQEITARSAGKSKYKWLFGGYAFYQLFDNAVGANVYAQKMDYLKKYNHGISGGALFHQSSLTDFPIKNLTLTAGLRIDFEKDLMNYYYDMTVHGRYSVMADTIYPSLRSNELMPRFAINYNIGKSNIYVVAARGYKTGGFNSTFERPQDLSFFPEHSWNYEAGIKGSYFRDFLSADLSFYYIDWRNQQIYQPVPSGRGSMLKNAGHSLSRGLEFSLKTAPVRGYNFMVAYGLTDAWFIKYVISDTENYNGNYLPYAPGSTLTFQAEKSISFRKSSFLERMKISALYRGAGRIYWNEKNSYNQKYYGLLDAKISLTHKLFQLDLWAKNLLNTDYYSFFFEALGNKYVQTGKPAQFGVNLGIKF